MISFDLKTIMAIKDVTIRDLAKKTGMSTTTISLLANEHSKGIQFNTLEKICNALNVTPNDLFIFYRGKFVFSRSFNSYVGEDGYTYSFINLYPAEIDIKMHKEDIMLSPEYFHALVLGYSVDEITEHNKQLNIRAGIPWMRTKEEMERYDPTINGKSYNYLEDTVKLLTTLPLEELQHLAHQFGEYMANDLFREKRETFNQVNVMVKLDNSDNSFIPGFSFKPQIDGDKVKLL